MKYLTEAFNSDFVELKGDKWVNSGSYFEELVCMLLKHNFPDIEWKDTPITHDGSKDFYAQKDDRVYWAECKNYNDKVSLQTIAPTLIMAELCNADEVYFFSQSEINENVKKKLCYYAHINQKKIRFYDDRGRKKFCVYGNFGFSGKSSICIFNVDSLIFLMSIVLSIYSITTARFFIHSDCIFYTKIKAF